MNKNVLAVTIRKRREVLKIQQRDLAEISGIALRTILMIENGQGNPSFDTLQKITNALGLKITIELKDK